MLGLGSLLKGTRVVRGERGLLSSKSITQILAGFGQNPGVVLARFLLGKIHCSFESGVKSPIPETVLGFTIERYEAITRPPGKPNKNVRRW